MVVIAIIIILAAIAIPNYLTMTARAKKSRVASDFAALATALETYKTDWNQYPVQATGVITSGVAYAQLTGTRTTVDSPATQNLNWGVIGTPGNTTAAGDAAPITYMTTNILASMANPYVAANAYQYTGTATTWKLSADTGDVAATKYLVRTESTTSVATASTP
jgi:type II secretory pathway pseudopilin PulG